MLETIVDFTFSAGLFINAALFIPQILLLLKKKHSNDVSLLTFVGFCLIKVFTIWHGYFTKDIILVLGYGISIVACGITTLLIIYYRIKKIDYQGSLSEASLVNEI